MLSQTDAENKTTTFTYDILNRREYRYLPGGQYEKYNYDPYKGTLNSKRTFQGDTISYTYYPQTDRLYTKTTDMGTVTYYYDSLGRRTDMEDYTGAYGYVYNNRDRLLSKTTPNGIITYTYDKGMLKTVKSSNADGTDITYNYDGAARIEYVVDNNITGNAAQYTYDNAGNLETCTYKNGVKHTWEYDNVGRLDNIQITNLLGNTIKSYNYELNDNGNRKKVTEDNGRVINWQYDDVSRLKSETITNAVVNGVVSWTYDAVGNRQTQTSTLAGVPTQDFTDAYDENDRLEAGYTYDDNGSTTGDGTGRTYTYDYENHLITVTGPSLNISYKYDADGNRTEKTVNGVTTKYLVDTNNPTGYSQVIEELQGTTVKTRYTYGLDLVSKTDVNTTPTTRYYGYDGQGSTRILTDEAGAITDTYNYSAFGTLLASTGTTYNNYLFHGEQYDQDLQNYYLRARYMDTVIGRFRIMDNYEGNNENPQSLHKYNFTINSINHIDPSGMIDIEGPHGERITELLKGYSISPNTGIYSKGYYVFPGQTYKHATVVLFPRNQKYWREKEPNLFNKFDKKKKLYFATIGAFPGSVFDVVSQVKGGNSNTRMICKFNDGHDVNDKPSNFGKDEYNGKEDDIIQSLISKSRAYSARSEKPLYTLMPSNSNEYNSNSFHVGLLKSVAATAPSDFNIANEYIGIWNFLPDTYFSQ